MGSEDGHAHNLFPRRQKNHLIISPPRRGAERGGGLHFTSLAAMTKEIPSAKGHSCGQPAVPPFHQRGTKGKHVAHSLRCPHGNEIPNSCRAEGPEPNDHIYHRSHRGFMTEHDTKRERGELPHSKLAGHIVIKNNFCETNLHLL